MEEEKTKGSFLGHLTSFMDRFTGDKVILLIALFLMLISVISVFSSTPRLANDTGSDRWTSSKWWRWASSLSSASITS